MFERIGRFATRYHFQIVAVWIAAAVIITLLAPSIDDVASSDQADFLPDNAPYQQADEVFKQAFPDQFALGSTYIVIDASKAGTVNDPAVWSFIQDLEDWLDSSAAPDNITKVTAPTTNALAPKLLVSKDQQLALVAVDLNTGHIDPLTGETLGDIDTWLEEHTPDNVSVHQTGASPVVIDTDKAIRTSVDRTIWVTVFLVIILLLLIYRSPVSPLIPLITVTISYMITVGLVAWIGDTLMTITSYVKVLLVVVLYGAGTDYCLFLISRFREEMADDPGVKTATRRTVQRVGETITSSAGTIFVGFMAMSLAEMGLFNSTGPALAVGVAVMLLAGLTLTPALLATLGERAFWPGKARHRATGRFYQVVSQQVSARPVMTVLIIVAVMAPFSIYGLTLGYTYDAIHNLPDDKPAVEGFNALGQHMDRGSVVPLNIVLTGNSDPQALADEIAALTDQVYALDGIASVRGMNSPFGQGEDYENLLRVDTQIGIILDQLQSGGDTLLADPDQAVAMLGSVQQYVALLGERFPQIVDDPDYQTLQTALTTFTGLRRVDGQITAALGILQTADASQLEPAQALALVKSMQDYVALLGERFPQIADNADYQTVQEMVNGNPLAIMTRQDELTTALTGLAQTFATMDDATVPLSDLMTVFEPLMPQFQALIAQQEGTLITAAQGVQARFAEMEDTYLLPSEAGDLFAALQPISDLYLSTDGTATRLQAILKGSPTSYDAMDTINQVRDLLKSYGTNSREAVVSGSSVMVTDIRDTMESDQLRAFSLVLMGIFLVLLIMLRSAVAPVYLILTVVLTFTTTLGITAVVFDLVFGVEQLTFWMPFFTFVFLVALGIDYSIFLMGRVKEEVARHGIREGVHIAVAATGGIITSAGIILAGTFAAMMAGEIKGLAEIGFAVSFGVLIDTFVVRTMLVPALTTLLGRWAWWPGGVPSHAVPEEDAGDPVAVPAGR